MERVVPPSREAGWVLELASISKRYGETLALSGVDLRIAAGETHALVGANGAGKSTLIRILVGAIDDYEGELRVDGKPVRFRSPAEARRAGIGVMHQELSLVSALSVEDALLLGEQGSIWSFVDRAASRRKAKRILELVGLDIDPRTHVSDLSLGTRQLVELARALAIEPRLLVLDEPTSALGARDASRLLEHVDAARERGAAVIFCSHRFDEVERVAQRITVLRDGHLVATEAIQNLNASSLVGLMLGDESARARRVDTVPSRRRLEPQMTDGRARTILETKQLSLRERGGSREVFSRVSFSVHEGEIVGITGPRGAGAEALLISLVSKIGVEGQVFVDGRSYVPTSPLEAKRRGLMLLAADRNESVFRDASILNNVSLSSLDRFARWIMVDRATERRESEQALAKAGVKRIGWHLPARALSGGNQQKLALARCLLASPRVLLLHEPTRGVDVAAKAEIHDLCNGAARAAMGIIVVSSDDDDLVALCDRVLVMIDGRITSTLAGAEISQANLVQRRLSAESTKPGASA